jgi:thioredoxin reductase (NADPH)
VKKLLFLLFLSIFSFSYAEESTQKYPVVIIGGGVGAFTSATYLARGGVTPFVITGPIVGGAIVQSHSVQNWPGELEISGSDLIDKMQKQAEANGAILQAGAVTSVDFSSRPFTITLKDPYQKEPKKIQAESCIIALGALPNMLGIPGEKQYWTRGVYNCAVCDGSLYKDKIVAIVGGGDSALTEAHYLSNIAKKVHVFVRKDAFKTVDAKRKQEILARSNIEVHYQTVVEEVKGNGEKVTHLSLKKEGNSQKDLPVDALFLAIGSKPNTELFKGQLELDNQGYILLKKHQQTSVEGVYAIGDVVDPEFKQAITAAGDAAKASLQAQKWLTSFSSKKAAAEEKKVVATPSIKNISSSKQLKEELQSAKSPLFVYFYSTYCGPCRAFSLQYEKWVKEYGNEFTFLKVNTQEAHELATQYGIRVIPTLVILDEKGTVLQKKSGSKELADLGLSLEEMKKKDSFDFKTLR